MHQKLADWLDTLGIKKITDLTDEEQETFQQWQFTLSKDELTVEDLMGYCRKQVARIEYLWRDNSLSNEQRARLIDQHIVYKNLANINDAPKEEKERLESQLDDMIKNINEK